MAEGEEVEPVPSVLLPCATCSRTFRPEALAKHTKVCEKTLMKKRKQFDSSKQRLQGTDPAYVPPPPVAPPKKRESVYKPSTNSKWREKHNDLVRTLKGKRGSEDVTASKPSDHEQCPHCERNFGPKAFDRHVEWCKEQQQKIKLHSAPVSQIAKERLEARVKYRAPLSNRILTKDKYSPGGSQKESLRSPTRSTPQAPRRNVQRTTSISTPSPSSANTPRLSRSQSVTRGSPNIREPSPKVSVRQNTNTHSKSSNTITNNLNISNLTNARVNNRNLQNDNHINNNLREDRFNEKVNLKSPSATKKLLSITSKTGDKRPTSSFKSRIPVLPGYKEEFMINDISINMSELSVTPCFTKNCSSVDKDIEENKINLKISPKLPNVSADCINTERVITPNFENVSCETFHKLTDVSLNSGDSFENKPPMENKNDDSDDSLSKVTLLESEVTSQLTETKTEDFFDILNNVECGEMSGRESFSSSNDPESTGFSLLKNENYNPLEGLTMNVIEHSDENERGHDKDNFSILSPRLEQTELNIGAESENNCQENDKSSTTDERLISVALDNNFSNSDLFHNEPNELKETDIPKNQESFNSVNIVSETVQTELPEIINTLDSLVDNFNQEPVLDAADTSNKLVVAIKNLKNKLYSVSYDLQCSGGPFDDSECVEYYSYENTAELNDEGLSLNNGINQELSSDECTVYENVEEFNIEGSIQNGLNYETSQEGLIVEYSSYGNGDEFYESSMQSEVNYEGYEMGCDVAEYDPHCECDTNLQYSLEPRTEEEYLDTEYEDLPPNSNYLDLNNTDTEVSENNSSTNVHCFDSVHSYKTGMSTSETNISACESSHQIDSENNYDFDLENLESVSNNELLIYTSSCEDACIKNRAFWIPLNSCESCRLYKKGLASDNISCTDSQHSGFSLNGTSCETLPTHTKSDSDLLINQSNSNTGYKSDTEAERSRNQLFPIDENSEYTNSETEISTEPKKLLARRSLSQKSSLTTPSEHSSSLDVSFLSPSDDWSDVSSFTNETTVPGTKETPSSFSELKSKLTEPNYDDIQHVTEGGDYFTIATTTFKLPEFQISSSRDRAHRTIIKSRKALQKVNYSHWKPCGAVKSKSEPLRLHCLTRKTPEEECVSGDTSVAKFCHECGTKYPVAGAKFCCNCGIRRLAV